MLFYLHYMLMTSGLCGVSVLLGVYFKTYTDASQGEIGTLLMSFPFVGMVIRPLFCSMADRHQAHRTIFIISLLVEMLGYGPFAIIPFFPDFYQQYPRLAWWVLVVACHLGNGGLGVAWSLGDCLTVNHSQKTGSSFGRMRLVGTLSWGFYGFIIGQINETPALPKYLPAFLILHLSLVIEIAIVALWDRSVFEMVDPMVAVSTDAKASAAAGGDQQPNEPPTSRSGEQQPNSGRAPRKSVQLMYDTINSIPSSLGSSLKMRPETGKVLREMLASEELELELQAIESATTALDLKGQTKGDSLKRNEATGKLAANLEAGLTLQVDKGATVTGRNPQFVLLKMILREDGRVLKYSVMFTLMGILLAPMNFLFLSMEELCNEREYNFSQLAGAVIISQALMESFVFFVVPYILCHISRITAMTLGLLVMSARWAFYSGWYYTSDISPYWAIVGEWGHGIAYGIFATILADVALIFANSSRLFIPELRKMGFLSKTETSSKEKIEAEENAIKMALRATIQALFGGFYDGLGLGSGSLLCGIFIDIYSYVSVWKMFFTISITSVTLYLLAELTKSRWSDNYEPRAGTKAHEIMQLSRAFEAECKRKAGSKRSGQADGSEGESSPPTGDTNKPAVAVPAAGC